MYECLPDQSKAKDRIQPHGIYSFETMSATSDLQRIQ